MSSCDAGLAWRVASGGLLIIGMGAFYKSSLGCASKEQVGGLTSVRRSMWVVKPTFLYFIALLNGGRAHPAGYL